MNTDRILQIPLHEIIAGDNDRLQFNQDALRELAESIQSIGLAQPITVRPVLVYNDGSIHAVCSQEQIVLWNAIVNLPKSSLPILPDLSTAKDIWHGTDLIEPRHSACLSPNVMTEEWSANGLSPNGASESWSNATAQLSSKPNRSCGYGKSDDAETLHGCLSAASLSSLSNGQKRSKCSPILEVSLHDTPDGLRLKSSTCANITNPQPDTKLRQFSEEPTSKSEEWQFCSNFDGRQDGRQPATDGLNKIECTSEITGIANHGAKSHGPSTKTMSRLPDLHGRWDTTETSTSSLDCNVQPMLEIVAGERRFRACQMLNMARIPCLVRLMDNENANSIMLAENLQRVDISPLETAKAFRKRIDQFAWTNEQIASHANVSPSLVARRLKLLGLCPEAAFLLEKNNLPIGHAEVMAQLDSNRQMLALRLFQGARSPSLQEFRTYCSQLMAEQSQESMFDLTEIMFETQQTAIADKMKRTAGVQTHPNLPTPKARKTVAETIEGYIADLSGAGQPGMALAICNLYDALVSAGMANVPTERLLPPSLIDSGPITTPAYVNRCRPLRRGMEVSA